MTMTETTAQTETLDLSSATKLSVNELILGRKSEYPIFDSQGVLLLSAGMEITDELKTTIKQRQDPYVYVNSEAVSKISLHNAKVKNASTTVTLDSDITKKLDSILDAGLMSVKNKGPAIKDDVVFLGRQGYDKEQRKKLVNMHEQNGKALGTLISDSLNGEAMDGSIVSAMAADYLAEMTTDTDNVLTSAIDSFRKDEMTGRMLEVSVLAMAIGIEMDLDADNCRDLAMAGLVHDWGMMKVPKEIRLAERRLTDVEMLEIKRHPIYSLEMLQRVSALPRVVSVIAYQVHERFNGTGYPRGRRGHSIHLLARILQVADAFIGMTSERPYRPPMMRYSAMECLIRQAKERSVDPDVVRALLNIQTLFPIGSFVVLSDGSIAQVTRRNLQHYTAPIVSVIQNGAGEEVDPEADENILDLNDHELSVVQALPTPGSNEIGLHEDHYRTSMG